MIWPGWQNPHCATSSSIQACCTLCSEPFEPMSPSTVVIDLPTTYLWSLTFVVHEVIAVPFELTVQAPHFPSPQPYFGLVIPRTSRRYHRRGMSPGTFAETDRPLTVKL